MSTVECMVLGKSFWQALPREELEATIVSRLPIHVSFTEIVEACERSDELTVVDLGDYALVGLGAFERSELLDMGAEEEVLPREAMSGRCVAVLEEGCTVEYVEDDLGKKTVLLPRLKELESDCNADPQGLLFAMCDALGLLRASHVAGTNVVSYY